MNVPPPLMFASLDLSRAPLMMALGLALMVFTWRLAGRVRGGSRPLLQTGAILLGIGYAVMMPLQDSGILRAGHEGHRHELVTDTAAWRMSKVAVMNLGWLLLGCGLAMQLRAKPSSQSPTPSLP
jgi:hypothetical protein